MVVGAAAPSERPYVIPRGHLTPKRFQDDDGTYFPFTVLDDRAGRETPRGSGAYAMIGDGKRATTLKPQVFAQAKAKADEGEKLLSIGDLDGAFDALDAAFSLLPDPKQQWNAAGWILVAMGECSFRRQRWKGAAAALQDSMICPGTLGNPWVHLRLGQARLELGEKDRAADELARAYMGGGREVFEGQDPKYFALVETVLKPPKGMDRLP
jgi:tetratricopeptide (TPR) repeat protein